MNTYTWVIRHSTVTFTFSTMADDFDTAYRLALVRIADDYDGPDQHFVIVSVSISD